MAMASRASVTVSIAEEMIGIFREIERVSRVLTSTPLGMTSEWPGVSKTSSKVSASRKEPFGRRSANTCSYAAPIEAAAPGLAGAIELAAAHSTPVRAGKRKVEGRVSAQGTLAQGHEPH